MHILKAGSKRRRRQAEMRDQYDAEQVMEAIDRENAQKVEEQTERIQNLE